MTLASSEQMKRTPWFAQAGAACSIIPVSRVVSNTAFSLKPGGYCTFFKLPGMDEEGLTDQELESRMRTLEGAFRGLPEGACLYQYTRVRSGCHVPRQEKYAHSVTETFVTDRLEFLKETANFRRIDLHWCLTFEPPQASGLSRKPKEEAGESTKLLSNLQKSAAILVSHLSSTIGLEQLEKEQAFQFLSYLFNLEDWAGEDHLRYDTGVDRQIVKSTVRWHDDHLKIGKRHVQMFSLQASPEASRPCLFSGLASLDCDSILCTSWRPKSTAAARKEIDQQEKFISFFKVGVLSRVMAGKDTASLETGASAKAANNSVDDLSDVIRSLDKKGQGEFSARLLISARTAQEVHDAVPAVHRIFVDARAQVMEETLGNLSAFFAMFPGNHKYNVFPLWMGEDHHARLSSVFAPHLGHPTSEDLNDLEYLNVLETRSGTPYFQDVYVGGVRVMLIIGPPGTGKTTALEVIREGAEKNGYTVQGLAPSSKAAGALRDAGVEAKTLQSFLASKQADPETKHLYMLDESSLASSKQMRNFLEKVGPNDRVLVIGDTRQHQAVDAGRPFQQMQDAGMRTAQLDQIMRQRSNPDLLAAVQQLATGEVKNGIKMLGDQGRITEIQNPRDRINAIAKDYAADPQKTLVVSPDNKSRQQINEAVRAELLTKGTLAQDGQQFKTLSHRNDMTGADRTWAARYDVGDVLQYTKGSKAEGLARDSFATVRAVDARTNLITVERTDGQSVTYDPRRIRGVNAYKETAREFATGDRIQFTAQDKELKLANRDLGTITSIQPGQMTVRLDGKKERSITFDPDKVRSLDHGYAVTSHSSQGLTERRVIANIDTEASRNLINTRLAYVAISRAETDARIYTNDAKNLGDKLAGDISKTAAVDFRQKSQTEQTREAVKNLKEKPAAEVKEVLKEQRRSYEYAHSEHRVTAVAMDYAARPDRAVVIAPDPGERKELTQLIRADLYAQGRLTGESRPVPVLVERELSNPKLAAQYAPGDQIHYKTGSPEQHGIAAHSAATVLKADARSNILTVETGNGEPVAYRPHELKGVTANSTVYRQETRELAIGERIQLIQADKSQGIRSGDFATVERIAENNALTVRLNNGRTAELDPEKARHIEYGYAVDGSKRVQADRVLATGETLDPKALASVPSNVRDLSVYTSDGSGLQNQTQQAIPKEITVPEVQLQPERQYRGFGLSR